VSPGRRGEDADALALFRFSLSLVLSTHREDELDASLKTMDNAGKTGERKNWVVIATGQLLYPPRFFRKPSSSRWTSPSSSVLISPPCLFIYLVALCFSSCRV
jgi:hypothetical protein